MKFEELLMQKPGDQEKHTKLQLQQQVEELEQELDGELQMKRVLQCAMQGPVGCCESCSCLSTFLPFKVQMLLAEVAVVEEEIEILERKINELKLDIYQERKQIKETELLQLKGVLQTQWDQRQIKKLRSRRPNQIEDRDCETLSSKSQYNEHRRRYRTGRERRASLGSSVEIYSATSLAKKGTDVESGDPRCSKGHKVHDQLDVENAVANANKLSVDLVKCLTSIFLNLNQETFKGKASTNLSKNTLACMNSKGLVSKATFSCKTPVLPYDNYASQLDPYGILPEPYAIRDVGRYKNFIQITSSTVDTSRLSECLPAMRRLRVLMQKLAKVNINYLNHKQKLAFWINVYNASIMHAFLQHGLPSKQEKQLDLINEATVNVGGIILKASTIEHFILRHPAEVKHELTDEKDMLLRQDCGLGYPEPNIIFALCRGSWSSPALRVYTADGVMDEIEKAKVEYLDASVGITSRKKILVPKLMYWHMKDFADDMESLIEWIYSQLPYTSSLKRLILECLNGETQSPSQRMIEIQPYVSEFRYLIPVY